MQESQGYTRTASNSRLTYDFEEENQDSTSETEACTSVEKDGEEYEVWFFLCSVLLYGSFSSAFWLYL